jgi:hypothetical protein
MDIKTHVRLSNKLKKIYVFNDHDISDEEIVKIGWFIHKIDPTKTEDEMMEFLDMVNEGKYGVLFKNPTCIFVMYRKYCAETIIKNHVINLVTQDQT